MANLSQPVAFRIYTKRIENQKRVNTVKTDINRVDSSSLNSDDDISGNKAKIWDKDWPELVLVFDCETTIDETQRLTFGAFRVYSFSKLVLEGLFYDDDLAKDDLDILNQWAESRKEGDIDKEVLKPLGKILLLSRTVFIKKIFMMVGYHRGGVIVGFNLPFDISRIAIGYDEPKKGLFKDGFVFSFKNYVDSNGKLQQDQFTPRVGVKSIDTKRAIIGFMNPKRDRQKKNHGQFVDLRSFSYTLTGKPHTLNSACEAFGLNMQKMVVEVHGKITLEYIDYCRKDVSLTWSLYKRLIEEYRHHPVSVLPSRLYSPASLGKGYLQAMNIRLPEIKIDAELGLDKDQIYGFAMQSYYGGRVECRIRKVAVPVVYCDFLSMYPTVNTLMGLWRFLTASEIYISDATEEIKQFIEEIQTDDLFNIETWKKLPVLVCIHPDGDFLPVRAWFTPNDPAIAWSYLHLKGGQSKGYWYTLADVLGSKILTGKTPEIVRAIRFSPVGVQQGLKPVKLNNVILIDPVKDDFFSCTIEERKRLDRNTEISQVDKERLSQSLKILANSTSYGVFVELNRDSIGENINVNVYSDYCFKAKIGWYEKPGRFFFPILGTLITSGAHLMLALVQYEVERRGGIYALMDTDSIAILASHKRNMINGADQYSSQTLSYSDVEDIVKKFELLNPYDERFVPGSVLKVEDENYPLNDDEKPVLDTLSGEFYTTASTPIIETEDLYGYAISSKRYALYNRFGNKIILRKASEHGLGMYLSPSTDEYTTEWIERFWLLVIGGFSLDNTDLKKKPALSRLTMSTPHLMKWVKEYNQTGNGKLTYRDSIKPFNFLIHPIAEGFFNPKVETIPILVGPNVYPDEAISKEFVDLHEPKKKYHIQVEGDKPFFIVGHKQNDMEICTVKNYADILMQYSFHREAKLVTIDGRKSLRNSFGLLYHPSIEISGIRYIGKETNMLDERQAGLVYSGTGYLIIEQDEWETEILSHLLKFSTREIAEKTGLSYRYINYLKQGKRNPSRETIGKIDSI